MKVIGAGFGRTGTASLKQALETLGFGPCHHMFDVQRDPDRARAWRAAADGDATVDWSTLLAGHQSTVDWPAAAFWRELAAHYPQARLILTVRDPEAWYDSAVRTIFRVELARRHLAGRLALRALTGLSPDLAAFVAMTDAVVFRRVFGGDVDDRRHAVAVFRRHVAEVRESVPADRLLVYDVTDGWAPLCGFLDVAVPAQEFPRGNEAGSFERDRRRRLSHLMLRRQASHG
jgi:hypothetical protein